MKSKKIEDKEIFYEGRHVLDTPMRTFQEIFYEILKQQIVEPIENLSRIYYMRNVIESIRPYKD